MSWRKPCRNESAGQDRPFMDESDDFPARFDAWQFDAMTDSNALTLPTPGRLVVPGARHGRQQIARLSGMKLP
jgi:hypothetical protein